jgi:hypothetical protein
MKYLFEDKTIDKECLIQRKYGETTTITIRNKLKVCIVFK